MSSRSDTNVPYDLSLLSGVPDPTSEENQSKDRHAPYPRATNRLSTAWKQGKLEDVPEHPVADVPWYRMGWGITAIVIVVVVIIGVAVGGAVGGTHHNSHKKSSDTSGGNPEPNGAYNVSSYGPSQSTTTTSTTTNSTIITDPGIGGTSTDSPTPTPSSEGPGGRAPTPS